MDNIKDKKLTYKSNWTLNQEIRKFIKRNAKK